MKLSKEAIEEFKEIYRKECGEEISDQEAYEKGSRSIELFKIIYKPIPQENKENLS
jgi:hypothetical protein